MRTKAARWPASRVRSKEVIVARVLTVVWGLMVGATGAWAQPAVCPIGEALEITLESEEFSLVGMDAGEDIVAVKSHSRLARRADRPGPIRLPARVMQLPANPPLMELLAEAHRAGNLELVLTVVAARHGSKSSSAGVGAAGVKVAGMGGVRIGAEPEASIEPDPHDLTVCGVLEPVAVAMRLAGGPGSAGVLTSRRLSEPIRQPAPALIEVAVSPPRLDVGVAPFPTEGLVVAATRSGEDCLRRTLDDTPSVQGALSVELRTSPAGQRFRPTVVVDGLVQRAVTACLVDALHADAAVWEQMPPAALIWLPFYFRGSRGASLVGVTDSDRLPSGSKPR